ncbi:DinB family protein [Eionea flava]
MNKFTLMAHYNQRMNQQLLTASELLTHQQLLQETHSFFSTVMGYWNHLLFGDLIMIGRLANNKIGGLSVSLLKDLPSPRSPQDYYSDSLEEVRQWRLIIDSIILDMAQSLNDEAIAKNVTYTTTEGQSVSLSVDVFCQHLFNHQTHHRGQLTCVLSQLGVDFGCTDLPIITSDCY